MRSNIVPPGGSIRRCSKASTHSVRCRVGEHETATPFLGANTAFHADVAPSTGNSLLADNAMVASPSVQTLNVALG